MHKNSANQHRSDITTGNKNIPTVRHFKACGLRHFQLTVVGRVRRRDVETRRARGSFWIERIRPAINGQTLSSGQTIAICQHNISQHCWAQHVACVWPPCCEMLRHVRCCWLKFDQLQTYIPIYTCDRALKDLFAYL